MGTTKSEKKEYYRISFGKITKLADKDTPEAKMRLSKEGKEIWELIFDDIYGELVEVKYREHSEYGNSWQITFSDNGLFILQISEESRYASEFLKRLPQMKRHRFYKFKPYDFEKNGERRVGLNIFEVHLGADDEKIPSFYQKFEGEGKDLIITNLHGYPDFKGDRKKKADLKKYFIDVNEFLREKAVEHLATGFLYDNQMLTPSSEEDIPPSENREDLPF